MKRRAAQKRKERGRRGWIVRRFRNYNM